MKFFLKPNDSSDLVERFKEDFGAYTKSQNKSIRFLDSKLDICQLDNNVLRTQHG